MDKRKGTKLTDKQHELLELRCYKYRKIDVAERIDITRATLDAVLYRKSGSEDVILKVKTYLRSPH